jgi:hypothetical protein
MKTGLQNRRSLILISKFKLLLDRTLSLQYRCRPSRRDFWKGVVGPCPGPLLAKSQPLYTDGESMMIEYLALKAWTVSDSVMHGDRTYNIHIVNLDIVSITSTADWVLSIACAWGPKTRGANARLFERAPIVTRWQYQTRSLRVTLKFISYIVCPPGAIIVSQNTSWALTTIDTCKSCSGGQ